MPTGFNPWARKVLHLDLQSSSLLAANWDPDGRLIGHHFAVGLFPHDGFGLDLAHCLSDLVILFLRPVGADPDGLLDLAGNAFADGAAGLVRSFHGLVIANADGLLDLAGNAFADGAAGL